MLQIGIKEKLMICRHLTILPRHCKDKMPLVNIAVFGKAALNLNITRHLSDQVPAGNLQRFFFGQVHIDFSFISR
jgi:hypothetical protein